MLAVTTLLPLLHVAQGLVVHRPLLRMSATTTTPPYSSETGRRAQSTLTEYERRPRAVPTTAKKTTKKYRIAVFLLNLGGPETSEDVEPFLYNLFADPDIIRLPPAIGGAQTALAWLIAKRRAPRSREAYDAIGGGSPITRFTNAQAQLLEDALNADESPYDFRCYVAMRYWRPFTDEALDRAARDDCQSAVVLPLYPHFSISTTGSSLRALLAEMQASHPRLFASHTVVPSWHRSQGYVDVVAKLVANEVQKLPAAASSEEEPAPVVLFSAHGVPVSYIEQQGDPYKRHIEETVDLVSQRVREILLARRRPPRDSPEFELSFQSRVGPVEWLRPYTDDALTGMAKRGVKRVVVVPISFVSEHIETLEEIDIEYREIAEAAGVQHWRRVPALNLDADFIAELKHQVRRALDDQPAVSTSEACVVNAFDLEANEFFADVIPQVQQDVFSINSRTAAIAIAATALFEIIVQSRAIHVVGLGVV